jgi:hypothetical protein
MGHVSSLRPLEESKWLGFEEKLMDNSSNIAEDPDPIVIPLATHKLSAFIHIKTP